MILSDWPPDSRRHWTCFIWAWIELDVIGTRTVCVCVHVYFNLSPCQHIFRSAPILSFIAFYILSWHSLHNILWNFWSQSFIQSELLHSTTVYVFMLDQEWRPQSNFTKPLNCLWYVKFCVSLINTVCHCQWVIVNMFLILNDKSKFHSLPVSKMSTRHF